MVKKAEQTQIQRNSDGKLSAYSNTIIDDNLLPSANELAKYQDISEDIVPWIMKRVEEEQKVRLTFNEDNMKLATRDLKFRQIYDLLALIAAIIIIFAAFVATIWLIVNGYNTAGSIFGSSTLVLILYVLLGKRKTEKNK